MKKEHQYRIIDGYVHKYFPSHPYSRKNGYIALHRLIVETKIGRYLTPKEVVHHKDEDKKNNSPKNLILYTNKYKHLQKEHPKLFTKLIVRKIK